MAQFMKVAFIILTLFALSALSMRCYQCSSEQECDHNPEEVNCSDELGCSKTVNSHPQIYTKGCFKQIGTAFVNKNECKEAKIGDIQGNYCRCTDKDLCNSASGYSLAGLSAAVMAVFAAKLLA